MLLMWKDWIKRKKNRKGLHQQHILWQEKGIRRSQKSHTTERHLFFHTAWADSSELPRTVRKEAAVWHPVLSCSYECWFTAGCGQHHQKQQSPGPHLLQDVSHFAGVCVCVCVREGERENMRVCVCVNVCVCACVCVAVSVRTFVSACVDVNIQLSPENLKPPEFRPDQSEFPLATHV